MPVKLSTLQQLLTEEGWNPQDLRSPPGVVCRHDGDKGGFLIFFAIVGPRKQLVVSSTFPRRVEPERRAAMVEFLMGINDGLVLGNFEITHGTREVRFRTSLDPGDGDLTASLLRPLAYTNVSAMEHYFEAIDGVMSGNLDQAAARALAARDVTP